VKTLLITGATDGLGKAFAFHAARQGHTLLLHGRNPQRGEQVLTAIRDQTGNTNLRYYNADFAELAQINAMAEQVLADQSRLDVLINNAGLGAEPERRESQDGIERIFQVDYLSTYMLTKLLLPLLVTSAPARIVNVASAGQAPIDFDDPQLKQHYSGGRAYSQAKLAQISFTMELAPELQPQGVTINALHPATYMPTKIVPNPISTIEDGVRAVAKLALDEDMATVTGTYFDQTREARAHDQAYDAAARKQLMDLSFQLCGV
jgi:NAD(P)-dependent dehydrogenase (short-subunit alcohol dehydrogenase family)